MLLNNKCTYNLLKQLFHRLAIDRTYSTTVYNFRNEIERYRMLIAFCLIIAL